MFFEHLDGTSTERNKKRWQKRLISLSQSGWVSWDLWNTLQSHNQLCPKEGTSRTKVKGEPASSGGQIYSEDSFHFQEIESSVNHCVNTVRILTFFPLLLYHSSTNAFAQLIQTPHLKSNLKGFGPFFKCWVLDSVGLKILSVSFIWGNWSLLLKVKICLGNLLCKHLANKA